MIMMEWTDIGIGTSVLIVILYYWLTWSFDFWKSRGIAGPSPKPFFGNMFNVYFGKVSSGEHLKMIYDANPGEPVIGVFVGHEPNLILKDLQLIANVMTKDFSTFPSHGMGIFNTIDGQLSEHLFNLEVTRWRPLRAKLLPTFASGKLKKMFYPLVQCAKHLEEKIAKVTLTDGPGVDCRELMTKYTIDVISNCVCGLQTHSLKDENNEFFRICHFVHAQDWKRILEDRVNYFAPWLFRLIEPFVVNRKVSDFFVNFLRDTIDYREKNQVVKHDFIDLLKGLRDNPNKSNDIELTDTLLAAQLYVFLLAGHDTVALTMSNALYELAKNQEIQGKLRDDIKKELIKNQGNLTYESVKSMKYLHMVFQETLRMYPPPQTIVRQSTQQYTFTGTDLTVPAGMKVIIPIFAKHRDPRYYPRPDVFDPERFTDEAIKARPTSTWLPFGDGRRQCIAFQFATYQCKVGLVKILERYKVEVCDKTQIPYVINTTSFTLSPNHGIHVKNSKAD